MYDKQISDFNIFRFFKRLKNTNKEIVPLDEVCYTVQISFKTNGQIRYHDEMDIPRIVEFEGISWTKTLLQSNMNKTSFSVFINNMYLKKDQVATLIKKVNGEVVSQKSFAIIGEKFYDGWFKLD
jgi:hypothetical protein